MSMNSIKFNYIEIPLNISSSSGIFLTFEEGVLKKSTPFNIIYLYNKHLTVYYIYRHLYKQISKYDCGLWEKKYDIYYGYLWAPVTWEWLQ